MTTLTLQEIAATARGRRRSLGWSQNDLARRIGVSRRWVSDFERGGGGASLDTVLRLLWALDLALDFVRDRPTAGDGADHVDLDALLRDVAG